MSSFSKEELERILKKMIFDVENDFWINVEDGFEGNCYWIPTPDDELDGEELVGIIELDADLEPFIRICALAHEVGHYFLHVDQQRWNETNLVMRETLAWYIGHEYFKATGYIIDLTEYGKEASRCVDAYVKTINKR